LKKHTKLIISTDDISNKKVNVSTGELKKLATQARVAILTMTTLSQSGHPGGSMSSIDVLLALYHIIKIDHNNPADINRDRVIVSNGHISPAVYATLALCGFFNLEDAVTQYRMAGSHFEGHIEPELPGIEWATGNLGQGLSAATGFALESKLKGLSNQVYCLMGDGEQQKGQLCEARRFATKYKLNNITAIIDYNGLQINGKIGDVMPQNILENYLSDGWTVLEIDGHDFDDIIAAVNEAKNIDSPVLILAHTVMSKGVSFMENKEKYHGSPLPEGDLFRAYEELNYKMDYQALKEKRNNKAKFTHKQNNTEFKFNTNNKVYDKPTDNRSAWGDAIADIARLNTNNPVKIAVFDCDLQGSVKTGDFAKVMPDSFIQAGIMEHHTAVCAGALSKNGIQTFFADFGVFGISETYNQHRLNDINKTNLKVVLTHVGLDVGEDGKTHQCLDYIGLVNNLYGYKLIIPADPNQTYKAISYVANQKGNFLISMGRSKLDIIKNENGEIHYGENYVYEYGKADILRNGLKACMFVTGTLTNAAIKIIDELQQNICLINISSPLDIEDAIIKKAIDTGLIFTLEDHNVKTGLGSIIAQKIVKFNKACKLECFGVNDYACSGTADDVYAYCGLSPEIIKERILTCLNEK